MWVCTFKHYFFLLFYSYSENSTLECSSILGVPIFSHQTIIEQREKAKTFDQIAEWLNQKGYLSVSGKKFKGAHVHSIVKKKRLRDKKFVKEYLEVRSDFHLDIFDRTLINMVKSDD